jgi:hypothetical protein
MLMISPMHKFTLATALVGAFALAPALAFADDVPPVDDTTVVDDGGQLPVDPVPDDGVPVGAPGDDGVVTADDGTPLDPVIYQSGVPEVQRHDVGAGSAANSSESHHAGQDDVWTSKPGRRSLFGNNSPWREWLNKKQ